MPVPRPGSKLLLVLLCMVWQLSCFPVHYHDFCTSLNCDSYKSLKRTGGYYGSVQSYLKERQQLIQLDTTHRVGQGIILSPLEEKANEVLMKWKHTEIKDAYVHDTLLPAQKFVSVKSKIEDSQVFKIIKKMPKGAVLHIHDLAMSSYDWLIKTVTTRQDCYICFDLSAQVVMFKVASSAPKPTTSCSWIPAPDARKMSGDPLKFDEELMRNLTMTKDNFATQQEIWKKFLGIFMSLESLAG